MGVPVLKWRSRCLTQTPRVGPAAGLLQAGSTQGELPRSPRPLLSVREAARLLDLSPATVYKLCAEGKLSHARILSAIRVVPADLGEFVMRRRRVGRGCPTQTPSCS